VCKEIRQSLNQSSENKERIISGLSALLVQLISPSKVIGLTRSRKDQKENFSRYNGLSEDFKSEISNRLTANYGFIKENSK
jgi:hypothetical protein